MLNWDLIQNQPFLNTNIIAYKRGTSFKDMLVSAKLWGCLHGGRKILELGRSQKADHPSAICFLYLVYMQEVVLGSSSRIFLVLGSSSLTARKILAPCKLPSLESSWRQGQKKQTWRRPGLHAIQLPKVDNFV